MADNFYIYETLAAAGVDVTDDGTGSDWLVLTGTYAGTATAPGAFLILSNFRYNAHPEPIDFAFAFSLPLSFPSIRIYGGIENAMGGAGAEVIMGSDVGNVLQGDPDDVAGGADLLNAFNGNDTLYGMGGNDGLYGGDGDDLMFGDTDPFAQGGNVAHGDDQLVGGAGFDSLFGGYGTNALNGGDNTDTASYAGFFDDFGNQSFHISADLRIGQVLVFARDLFSGTVATVATDTLFSVERVIGTGGDDEFHATTDGTISGQALTFVGGDGDDTYIFDGGPGIVVELTGGGHDHIIAAGSFVLPNGIEDLTLTPIANPSLDTPSNGNDLANLITGCDQREAIFAAGGNDLVFGNGGTDALAGESGNDTIHGGDDADLIEGNTGNDVLYGEAGRDQLSGNEGRDSLYGGDAGDVLQGQQAVDLLSGGAGNDTLIGGQGADRATGGGGADTFAFLATADVLTPTTGTRNLDQITDFQTGIDKIDISALGQAFIGGARFHGVAGEVRFQAGNGLLSGDIDGDGLADWGIALTGSATLVAGDLIL